MPATVPDDPLRLSALLDLDEAAKTSCLPKELVAVLEHQLATPLAADLDVPPPATWAGMTFGQLLGHPAPAVEALERVKDFAKDARTKPGAALPPEIATILYYASIAAARVRCGRRISGLDDLTLRRGLQSILEEPWCGPPLRPLMEEALGHLGPHR